MGNFTVFPKPRSQYDEDFNKLFVKGYRDPLASDAVEETPPEAQPVFVDEGPKEPTELQRLQNAYNQKPSKLQRILSAAIPAAGIALGGIFGGSEGATGAAIGASGSMQRNQELEFSQKKNLLEQIEAEKNRQATAASHQATLSQQIATLKQAAEQNELNRQNALKVAEVRKPVPQPGRDVPYSPEVLAQQKELKIPAPMAGRDIPLPEPVFTQQKQLKAPVPQPGRDIPFSPEVFAQRKQLKDSGGMNANSLTPEGIDIAAEMFSKTGTLPSLGMGQSGMRAIIINRAAELHPKVDLASNKADYEANKSSLTQLQRNRDAVVSFENTALKNLDIFTRTAKSVIDSGSPLINTPLRAINERGLGSKELSAFQAARRVAINEIAKVTSNPNLTGQLSDAARREVETFIPATATLAQIYSVANILKQDMTNRHESLDEQIEAIKQRIGGSKKKPSPGGSSSVVKFDSKGNRVK